MEWIKPGTKIDFIGKRMYFFMASLILIGLSLFSFFWPGPKWGIDFKGGTEIRVRFSKTADIGDVRKAVSDLGLGEVQIQTFQPALTEQKQGVEDFLVRTEKLGVQQGNETVQASKLISDKLTKVFGEKSFQMLSVDYVGPKVGHELRFKGVQAVLYSLIGILIYVGFRFEFRYALGAVFALFHDAIICAGFYNVIQHDWSLAIIAALMTVIGYSNNDTIVVYARIRETVTRTKRGTLHEIMNVSLNDTLSRTLLTSFVTFVSLLFLDVFGTGVLRDFSLVLLVGVVVGTYSSIYIASSFVLVFEDLRGRKPKEQSPKKA